MDQEKKLLKELEKGMNLKEVSDLLGIPSSTLRYWDKEGLVKFERDWQNDYRKVSTDTLMTLLDIRDLREMDISIDKIKLTAQMNVDELSKLMNESQADIQQKIFRLQQTLEKIQQKQATLQRIKQLENTPPTLVFKQMPTVYRVDFQNRSELFLYLTLMQSVDILSTEEPNLWFSGTWTPTHQSIILREADHRPMPYLHGLLCIQRDNMQDNLDTLVNLAYEIGYRPKQIISQYLSAAFHKTLGPCDYHECWVELVLNNV